MTFRFAEIAEPWAVVSGLGVVSFLSSWEVANFVDTTSGERIRFCSLNAGESLVVSEVEVGLHTIYRYVAFHHAVFMSPFFPLPDINCR